MKLNLNVKLCYQLTFNDEKCQILAEYEQKIIGITHLSVLWLYSLSENMITQW